MNKKNKNEILQPRLIRLKNAPKYLGTNINYFNRYIRPYLTEIRLSRQNVSFDRLDLDHWVEHYKNRNGMSRKQTEGDILWVE
jgi:hypothetical protein